MSSPKRMVVPQLVSEMSAMAAHALGAGLAVPGWIIEIVARAEALETPGSGRPGVELPGHLPQPLRTPSLGEIARAHAELAKLVAPATPDLILMLEIESDVPRIKRVFGQARITRSFMFTALLAILCFIATSLSSYVNDPQHGDVFTSSGLPLFINELFFLSSAAVGASFSLLFQIDREITAGTLSPKHQSSYWVQFILGIVAGLLLSTVLSVHSLAQAGAEGAGQAPFRNAVLALVGGFSSSVVQRLIRRIIEALETVVRGSAEQEMQLRENASRQRLDEALSRERLRTMLLLTDLQRRLMGGESPEALRALLARVSQSLFSSDATSLPAGIEVAPVEADSGAAGASEAVSAEVASSPQGQCIREAG